MLYDLLRSPVCWQLAGWKRSPQAPCNGQGIQRMGCLCAERLDSGDTSGSPLSREADGDGAARVLNCSGFGMPVGFVERFDGI
jgi:hypothetical protein